MLPNILDRVPHRLVHAVMIAVLATPCAALGSIVIPTVSVGNVGNTADTRLMNDGSTGYGAVGYVYSVGKYEVTAAQYTAFLNAVAATDTYGLYNPAMASDEAGCQIVRTGASGSYTYSISSVYADRPVNYVSWGDAARFSNWLANGQPTGTQTATATERGSYTLDGATSAAALVSIARNSSATWFITSENEWYKAAFYNGATGTYYNYATASNVLPSNQLVDPDPGNNANYRDAQNLDTLSSPYYRTEVGAFENSDSPFGTFDQNGNVWEWSEATYFSLFRAMRGGSIGSYDVTLSASFRYFEMPDYEANTVGFRVASTMPDADQDGRITIDDYFLIDVAYSRQASLPWSSYRQCDFNGDGAIGADDYFLLDTAFLGQSASFAALSPEATSVPEPALSLPAIGTLCVLRRRRR